MKRLMLIALLFITIGSIAQTNFTYTPEKPQPGEEISFIYTQGGDLSGIMAMPEAFAMVFDSKNSITIVDIPLKREYGKLVGRLTTDTAIRTAVFGFTIDGKFDHNDNKSFIIPFYHNDKPYKESFAHAANVYGSFGEWKLGMKNDHKEAMKMYDEMFKIYPDAKAEYYDRYLQAFYLTDKEKGTAAIQKEIENTLRAGLKEEKNYDKVGRLYNALGYRQQAAFIAKLKKEKFPSKEGFDVNKYYEKFIAAPDIAGKEIILKEVEGLVAKETPPGEYASFINFLKRNIATGYSDKKDWNGFKNFASKIKDERAKANLYNSTAWKMQEDSTNLKLAEELSRYTITYGKADWKNPKGEKPKMQRYSEWIKQKESDYATYADTYAMILYRMGNYKKAIGYAKEAQLITKGESVDHNNTYALIAEKAMKPKQYKPLLEKFVRDGKANATITGILKKLYIANNKSDSGFDTYISGLEKEAYEKMLAEIKKEMRNDTAPKFTLKDLQGNTVSLSDFKNKVVVVDFWATWCGPCIASMPSMQKMVNKYKDDPDVKFLFIDTWQNEDNEAELVRKFIADKKYSEFHVLMDLDDKVVGDYKVTGIPTKFVIGKNGNIKFQDVGFGGEDNLIKKLNAMIDLAKNN